MLIWSSISNTEKKLCLQNALVEGSEASVEETSRWTPLTLRVRMVVLKCICLQYYLSTVRVKVN
jgi:hypothetical protein